LQIALALSLHAQVDQDHWTDSNLIVSDNLSFGIQQEFIPGLDAMDSVEIKISMGIIDPLDSNDGLLAVKVREGAVNGPILAASAPVYIPPLFRGDVLLRFTEPVQLDPGRLYVLEPFSLTPGTQWAINANQPGFGPIPNYSGGRLFFNGQFVAGDLIFREGISIPEPEPWRFLAWSGGLAILSRIWLGWTVRGRPGT
jgi:hypothetical protein